MSWSKLVTIWCDAKGCTNWIYGVDSDPSIRRARANARKCGWTFGGVGEHGFFDLCPEHSTPGDYASARVAARAEGGGESQARLRDWVEQAGPETSPAASKADGGKGNGDA